MEITSKLECYKTGDYNMTAIIIVKSEALCPLERRKTHTKNKRNRKKNSTNNVLYRQLSLSLFERFNSIGLLDCLQSLRDGSRLVLKARMNINNEFFHYYVLFFFSTLNTSNTYPFSFLLFGFTHRVL